MPSAWKVRWVVAGRVAGRVGAGMALGKLILTDRRLRLVSAPPPGFCALSCNTNSREEAWRGGGGGVAAAKE